MHIFPPYGYKKNKLKRYYYCDNREECNASVVWSGGKWGYGGKVWNDNGTHITHMPNRDRAVAEIVKGQAKLISNCDPLLTPNQVLDRSVRSAPLDSQTCRNSNIK
ncbi:unnamed protein product [Orchesella dallaii]|uniref:FLYWCH-type domain-containing protein n=1 Tax=Orchesella dallaii TaxID=48710 RepID=A0ABP1QQR2_9HEXA